MTNASWVEIEAFLYQDQKHINKFYESLVKYFILKAFNTVVDNFYFLFR